jgi:hypothetical protein
MEEPNDEKQIPENSKIVDRRTRDEFKIVSFSSYKKTEVKNQLLINLITGKVEPSCYWTAELVCAGHFMDIWEILFLFLGKHIHLGNPKLPIYIEKRFLIFRNVMLQGLFYDELQLRNHCIIRELFAEMICVLAISPKKHSIDALKINRVEEFDMTKMPERLRASSVEFAEPFFQKEDPKELWIAVNEFAYQLTSDENHSPNTMLACYWIEWVIEFEQICKMRKQPCFLERRTNTPVENKYKTGLVWLLWDALFHITNDKKNLFLKKIIDSIYQLFCIQYTSSTPKKRRYLLYFAVSVLTEPVQTNIEMISNKPQVEVVIKQIHTIYRQIKKNEQAPTLDYLYNGLETQSNLDKTIQKMEILGNMDVFSKGSL